MCHSYQLILVVFIPQIHTGLQHGVIFPPVPEGLPLSFPTLADKLRETGYATHMVGKWHLGYYKKEYTPIYRGFDSFYGEIQCLIFKAAPWDDINFRF